MANQRQLLRSLYRFRTKFAAKDVMQVVVGAAMIAVPASYSDEAWRLGQDLPTYSITLIWLLSLAFIGTFVYYNYYQRQMERHWDDYLKRVLSTYIISFVVVCLVLTLIEKAPWWLDYSIAIRRAIIIAFPASMGGAVADTLK